MIKVEIQYEQESTIFSCDENVKFRTVFRKFALFRELNYEEIYFLNSRTSIILSSNEFKKSKLKDVITENEKKEGFKILVYDCEFERTESNISTQSMMIDDYKEKIFLGNKRKEQDEDEDEEEEESNEYQKEFKSIKINGADNKCVNDNLDKNINSKRDDKYLSVIKSYLIPIILFAFVSLIFGVFSFKELNNSFKNGSNITTVGFINLIILIILGISISILFIPTINLIEKKYIISIYFFAYTLCLIFLSFLLTKYINYKDILICLVLEITSSLSIGIFIIIIHKINNENLKPIKNYKYAFFLVPFITNEITIIIFTRDFKILYISIFSLVLAFGHSITSYFIFKNIKTREIILNSFYISLNVFYPISLGIYKYFNHIKSKFLEFGGANAKPYMFKVYSVILLEFTLIWLIVFIGFYYSINDFVIDNYLYFLIPCIIILIVDFILKFIKNLIKLKIFSCSLIISFNFVFIIFCFLISYFIKDKNIILCALSLIYLDIVSMEIYLIFCNIFDTLGMILSPILINGVSLPFFYFFWIKDVDNIIYLSIFSSFILLFNYFIFKKLFIFINTDFSEVLLYILYINLSILFSIDMIIDKIKNIMNNNDNEKKSILSLKINSVELIYLILFIIITYLFSKSNKDYTTGLYFPLGLDFFLFTSGLFAIYVFYALFYRNENQRKRSKILFFLINIFYIGVITLVIPIIAGKPLIIILLMLLIDILTIIIFSLFVNNFNNFEFIIYPAISHILSTIIIYLIKKDFNEIILLSGISLGYLIYIIVIELCLLTKVDIYVDECCYSVSLINYLIYFFSSLFCEVLLAETCFFLYKPLAFFFCRDFKCRSINEDWYNGPELCWCEKCKCCCLFICCEEFFI